jgi:hypothetical protein
MFKPTRQLTQKYKLNPKVIDELSREQLVKLVIAGNKNAKEPTSPVI